MNMKLVHIQWNAGLGGAERAVFQLAQHQSSQGLKVAVAFGKAVGPFAERLQDVGVPVIDLGLQSAHELSALPRIRRLLAPYAIHHFHGAEPLIMLASLLVRSARRVYTYRAGEHRRSRKQRLRYWFASRCIRLGFHAVSANTAHAATMAKKLLRPRTKVFLTYNGLDFDLLSPRKTRLEARQMLASCSENEFIIGTVSNLKAWKRTDWLLRRLLCYQTRTGRLLLSVMAYSVPC